MILFGAQLEILHQADFVDPLQDEIDAYLDTQPMELRPLLEEQIEHYLEVQTAAQNSRKRAYSDSYSTGRPAWTGECSVSQIETLPDVREDKDRREHTAVSSTDQHSMPDIVVKPPKAGIPAVNPTYANVAGNAASTQPTTVEPHKPNKIPKSGKSKIKSKSANKKSRPVDRNEPDTQNSWKQPKVKRNKSKKSNPQVSKPPQANAVAETMYTASPSSPTVAESSATPAVETPIPPAVKTPAAPAVEKPLAALVDMNESDNPKEAIPIAKGRNVATTTKSGRRAQKKAKEAVEGAITRTTLTPRFGISGYECVNWQADHYRDDIYKEAVNRLDEDQIAEIKRIVKKFCPAGLCGFECPRGNYSDPCLLTKICNASSR